MKLKRPLVFLDLETTGPDVATDRIVEIATVTRNPDGSTVAWRSLVHPGRPIPAAASKIHGITDADVEHAPRFSALAHKIHDALEECDLGGYNVRRFDLPLLMAEMGRAGVEFSLEGRAVVDPQVIFFKLEPRDLTAAFRRFCGRELVGAHSAIADTQAALEVFDAQIQAAGVPSTLAEISAMCAGDAVDLQGKFTRNESGEVVCAFGPQRGVLLATLAQKDPGFLRWILDKDFASDTKALVRKALVRAANHRAALPSGQVAE